MKFLQIGALGLVTSLLAVAAHAGTPPSIYTDAQAKAGEADFVQNCAMCHGANLEGGAAPALIGQAFAAPSNNYTVAAIFAELSQQMPAGEPGSLTHTQYEDIMAYILQKNGYPAGTTAISYDKALTDTTPLVSQVK
ncbi:c-type cytochrome [Acidocella sp.]|uniref:c-type cytochrome n=1 Tax=Acidocella sp. TaxID=50710 RepID=UPI003D020F2B